MPSDDCAKYENCERKEETVWEQNVGERVT